MSVEDAPPPAAAEGAAEPAPAKAAEDAPAPAGEAPKPAENGAAPAAAPADAADTAPVEAPAEAAPAAAPEGGVGTAAPPAEEGGAEGGAAADDAPQEPEMEAPDMDTPLPLDHVALEDGKKGPLPGVESVFCTNSTLALLGLNDLVEEVDGRPRVKTKTITKDELLKDIQFRGSISDFHYLKAMIQGADYDPLIVRYNEDDIYGDSNNIELVLKKEAADVWQFILDETEKRRKWAELQAAKEAAEKALPKSKRTWKLKPWVSLGSEAEIEEYTAVPTREPIVMTAQRRRREFNQEYKFGDKDSHELWNSAQMECRPFKDPNFDLRRMEMDLGTQAVPETREFAVQATGLPPCPGSSQCIPREMSAEERKKEMASEAMKAFLALVTPRMDEALQQNEITNVFEDDFATLAEEDGMSGNKKENVISEYQSFTDLEYSKNKVVQAIQWVPGRKGVVAVACTEPLSFTDRVKRAGRTFNSAILIWNFKDPIHPEFVLEAPFEVTSFSFNPVNHNIVTAGLFNGRVVYWDTANESSRITAAKSVKEDGQEDEASVAVIRAAYTSAPDTSHKTLVTDLSWLKGLEITRDGRVIDIASEDAQEKGISPKECNFFATTAADGNIMFWDVRIERSRRRGQKETEEISWSPLYVVPLLDQNGRDLAALKFSFNKISPMKTEMMVGSADGEIVLADYCKPEGIDHPEYSKFCVAGHSGPVVSVQRSPFYEDIILTVGDWCFNVWKEGMEAPIFGSPNATNYLTAGCWSPTRAGVVYIAKQDGELDVWDLLDRSHEPAITATISSTPILSLCFNELITNAAQQMLAVGDSVGALHIMELPRNLRRPVSNEKNLMRAFLDREENRVGFIESELAPLRAQRLKEIEAEAQAAKDKASADADKPKSTSAKKVSPAEQLEEEYQKLEYQFKVELGLIAEDEGET